MYVSVYVCVGVFICVYVFICMFVCVCVCVILKGYLESDSILREYVALFPYKQISIITLIHTSSHV